MVTFPEPRWLAVARALIGVREVPGPKHSSIILGWIKTLGGWFKDDETPWCGTFVAHCIREAGMTPVKNWFRAKAWAEWGKPCTPCLGAIAVFGRDGGGHVGFLVGQTRDRQYLLVLGGNQGNAVSVMALAKDRLIATRWPVAGEPISDLLPILDRFPKSVNEE